MKERKNILEILYNAFDRLSDEDLVIDKFYIEQDGEMIHVANLLNERYREIFDNIKKLNKTKLKFNVTYQDALLKMMHELSASSIKVLVYLMSQMKYRNCVFGFKYTDLIDNYGMSYSTITKAMNELKEKKYIKVDGKRTNLVYHITPAVCWKGSVYAMKDKLKMFVDE